MQQHSRAGLSDVECKSASHGENLAMKTTTPFAFFASYLAFATFLAVQPAYSQTKYSPAELGTIGILVEGTVNNNCVPRGIEIYDFIKNQLQQADFNVSDSDYEYLFWFHIESSYDGRNCDMITIIKLGKVITSNDIEGFFVINGNHVNHIEKSGRVDEKLHEYIQDFMSIYLRAGN